MKGKRYWLGGIVIILILAVLFYLHLLEANSVVLQAMGDIPCIDVNMQQSSNRVSLWQDEEDGKAYFFLPSCVHSQEVKIGECAECVEIDGQVLEKGDTFTWEEDREYHLCTVDREHMSHEYQVTFMRSANIPSVFINTESGNMEYVDEERHNAESGDICVVLADGVTEYQNQLPKIASRGNVTWHKPKKPYTIKLEDAYPLCGLRKGDKWRLLALWNEGSKLNNKIAFDIAEELGMANTVQGTWIDLYLNGEYAGIYLLTETVTVGEGRVDIYDLEKENRQNNENIDSAPHYEEDNKKGYLLDQIHTIDGGYLIEKDTEEYYEGEKNGFVTSAGYRFTIKEPMHASREQVDYIAAYVDRIDQMVQNGDPAVWEYLDMESLVSAFLVDEISLETDLAVTSMYFYKDAGNDKLYTGPVWDYEHTFGERNVESLEGRFVDYTYSVVEHTKLFDAILNWYMLLYDTPEFQEKMVEEYEELLPFFEELLDTGMDAYVERIEPSVKMDRVLWQDKNIKGKSAGTYEDYYANVKYTKFFIAKRLNYLCERWGVSHEEFPVPSNGQMHQVTYSVYEGVVGTMEVMDGEELKEPLEYDQSKYQGWIYEYSGEKYSPYIPIYEDMGLYNAKWE